MAPRIVDRDRRDRLGEGLLWSPRDDAVYWTDILDCRVNRLRLADNRIDSWHVPGMIGWLIERREAPGFVAAIDQTIVLLTLDPLTVTPLATPEPVLPGHRLNDALADPWGRLWAGTMPLDGSTPTGVLYRLDRDGGLVTIDRGYRVTNGPAISADRRWLYHNDSPLGRVYRFPLDDQGNPGERSQFLQFADDWGKPDGMAVDAEGGLWIAHWGGGCISRFLADGTRDRVIALPASQITNIVFAGPELDRMFVSSASDGVDEPLAGALFELSPGVRGLPPGQYAG